KWKVKTLSIGGRLTLLKSVLGASPLYNMSIYKSLKVFDQSLRVRFPRLFDLETDKESTVASKLGPSSVDASFRRSVSDRVERQQWDDLNSVLGYVTLFASKDRWICDLNGDGVFRVK
nr:RNA-directed DNA polymerase, eukaryota, reverse transcriptase zinc-binding domain protein [Tanacetum cinerariifolium]